MSGVANPLLPAAALDTPMTYEDLRAAGGGLGAAGFIVFDDTTDLVAVAAGVARFLAVESCGQCRHCKDDGLAARRPPGQARRHRTPPSATSTRSAVASTSSPKVRGATWRRSNRSWSAACCRASPTRSVPTSGADDDGREPVFVAELAGIVDGRAVLDEAQAHEAARLDARPGRLRPVARRPARRPPRGRRVTIRSATPRQEP